MKLINNQSVTLISELKNVLNNDSEVFIASGYLTIPALFELNSQLQNAQSVRVLIDSNADLDTRFAYYEKEFNMYFNLDAKYKASSVYGLVKDKFQIRHGNAGGQKFILIKNNDKIHCFSLVAQDVNCITLGVETNHSPIVLTYFEDNEGQFLGLFEQFWNNSLKDVKDSVLNSIEKAVKDNSPEFIYKYTLFNLFQHSTINEESEQRIERIGFKQTQVWSMLFNFQRDAVLGAIDKIETFGGCIIADSVGLGKTFEALAIMKYYQMRNFRLLVLCPKKLRDNWQVYSQNDIRNILSKDRISFDVLNHTDLSRTSGMSGHINLKMVNWGNYDLVVIDESHNFRNNNPRRDGITRYQRLMNDIIKTGVKTKILMLSATPVNTRMNDIKNQFSFITEQNDKALMPFGIASIEQTLRKAQAKFNAWLKDTRGTAESRDKLISVLDGSYFKLLELLTIARSRQHIEKYYDVSDIGKFPERLIPINKYANFDINGVFQSMDKVNDELNALNLGFYSPLSYVRADKRNAYEEKYDITTSTGSTFKQIERENSLIHLMRVNLLKRIESSVHAFRLTLNLLLNQIDDFLTKIENVKQNDYFDEELDINKIDPDDDVLEDLLAGGKIKVLLQDMDLIRCKEDLLDDKKRLSNLLAQATVIDEARDAKLQELKELILHKVKNNINKGNNKIIVFSAFADTVIYLYDKLNGWAKKELGLNSALVTGGDGNKTNMKGCKSDLSSILINFSPISKSRNIIFPNATDDIDLMFCTDCISEGQNLQDCDYLVNYDIHWNPVRIVQRFGRIDRIGSKNECIQLVNFFPNLELDAYINLIGRVKGRMQMLDVSATGDDNIIEETSAQHHDLEYRKRQLIQMQGKVLNLEDIDGGISITDLTFNDFKIDVERLQPQERSLFESMPKSIFSITESNLDDAPSGVLFCLRDLEADITDNNTTNVATFPFSLCYIDATGEIFAPASNPKKALDYYKKLCVGKNEVLKPLFESFSKETRNNKSMSKYSTLLSSALSHIKGVDEELGLDTLAVAGGTKMSNTLKKESFEVVSFLIIKG
jgi:SNF2 family DNA or RNA helicase